MKKQRTKRAYYRAFSTSDGPAVAKIRADTPAKARILLHADRPSIEFSFAKFCDLQYKGILREWNGGYIFCV